MLLLWASACVVLNTPWGQQQHHLLRARRGPKGTARACGRVSHQRTERTRIPQSSPGMGKDVPTPQGTTPSSPCRAEQPDAASRRGSLLRARLLVTPSQPVWNREAAPTLMLVLLLGFWAAFAPLPSLAENTRACPRRRAQRWHYCLESQKHPENLITIEDIPDSKTSAHMAHRDWDVASDLPWSWSTNGSATNICVINTHYTATYKLVLSCCVPRASLYSCFQCSTDEHVPDTCLSSLTIKETKSWFKC